MPNIINTSRILMSSRLYNFFHKDALEKASELQNKFEDDRPIVYLIGMNDKGLLTQKILLKNASDGGCEEMPDLDHKFLTKAYIAMAKKNITPCGLARVTPGTFDNDGYWGDQSGSAIFHSGLFMISASERGIVIQRKTQDNQYVETVTWGVTNKVNI